MRLQKPSMVYGSMSYEQRYSVSSWAAGEALGPPPVSDMACIDNERCSLECDPGNECVKLANQATDREIKCAAADQ